MSARKKNKRSGESPRLNWQTGLFAETQSMQFALPYGFLLLCKLWNISPRLLLGNFMNDLSCGSWNRENKDGAKTHLQQYILSLGYGADAYSSADVQQMFAELDAIGRLFPDDCSDKMLDLHIKWRNRYYDYWYRKWQRRYRRPKKPQTISG